MKKPAFNPNDFDLPGIRQMLVEERLDRIALTTEFWRSLDYSGYADNIMTAIRSRDPAKVGIAFLAGVKNYLRERVSEYDCVDRALQLHNDFYSPTNEEELL